MNDFDRNDWQGRSKTQVEEMEKMSGIVTSVLILATIIFTIVSITQ